MWGANLLPPNAPHLKLSGCSPRFFHTPASERSYVSGPADREGVRKAPIVVCVRAEGRRPKATVRRSLKIANVKCGSPEPLIVEGVQEQETELGTPVTAQISFVEVHDILAISVKRPRAASSVGRARRSQRRGRGFESHAVHQLQI